MAQQTSLWSLNKNWPNSPRCAPSARSRCCNTSLRSAGPCRQSRAAAIWPRCSASPSVFTNRPNPPCPDPQAMSITTDAQPSPEASASVSLRRDESARQADARDRADMERLAAGHDAALNDLMERHATPVFHFLCRMVGNEDDANDLAQETFVRVFRARTSFRTDEKFFAWLYTIAANLARNHFRWRARHPNVSLET